jgi:hypothetical protein
MAGDGELGRLVCERGCGEWYARDTLEQRLSWPDIVKPPGGRLDGLPAQAQPWPWSPALCPTCNAEMAVGYRAEVRFDVCNQHGVWLDAGEIERFAQLFRLS